MRWILSIVVVVAALIALNWPRLGPWLAEATRQAPPLIQNENISVSAPSPTPAPPTRVEAPRPSPAQPAPTSPPTASDTPRYAQSPDQSTTPSTDESSFPQPAGAAGDAPAAASDSAQPPSRQMARALAEAPRDAVATISESTLERLAAALPESQAATTKDTAAETTTGSTRGKADEDESAASQVVKRTAEVEVRALAEPTAPVPLAPSGSAPAAAAPGANPAAVAATTASADPNPAKAARPSALLARIAEASAEQLADVPVVVLAEALSELRVEGLAAVGEQRKSLPAAIELAKREIRIDHDARDFIRELTRPSAVAIPAARADHFVRPGQRIELGLETLPPVEPLKSLIDRGLGEDEPISRVRITHRLEPIKTEELLARATRSPASPIRIVERETIKEIPLAEALRRQRLAPHVPLTVVREVRELEPTTLAELRESGELAAGELPEVVAGAPTLTQRTVEELLGLNRSDSPDNEASLYYVRTVQKGDIQGIWGIIQSGLIDNFARGMAIRRGAQTETYRVHIPRLADEPIDGNRSSFLGRMIFHKMRRSTIFNIRSGRITRNPENITPGQQIIIVDFAPEELVRIYRHFTRAANAS